MTATLLSGIRLAEPAARLNTHYPDHPFVTVDLDEEQDTYLRYHSADEVLPMLRAHLKAWRLLNPDGPLDALMAELLDEPDLAKIRARILEEDAGLARCAKADEPWCGARTVLDDLTPFGCTAIADHAGLDHVAYGPEGDVCYTWPQDAAPDEARMHQALGICWCHYSHSVDEALTLNHAAPDTAPEGLCPEGCGCRLGTDDADRRECGCDGPCTGTAAHRALMGTSLISANVQVCFWCGIEGTGMKQISVVPEGLKWECTDAEACRHGNRAYAAPDTAQHSCEVCCVPVTGGEIGPGGVTWLCEDHRADAPDTAQPEDIPSAAAACRWCATTEGILLQFGTLEDGNPRWFCGDVKACYERKPTEPGGPEAVRIWQDAAPDTAQPEDSPVPSHCYWCGTTEGDLVTFGSTDDGSEARFCKDVDACYTRKPSPGGRTCPDCGAVGLPVRDAESHCYNRERCAERRAAKAGIPIIPAAQIEAEVAADVHRLGGAR